MQKSSKPVLMDTNSRNDVILGIASNMGALINDTNVMPCFRTLVFLYSSAETRANDQNFHFSPF